MKRKIVVGIGGSSGAIYAKVLLDKLSKLDNNTFEICLVYSENAKTNWNLELEGDFLKGYNFKSFEQQDFFAPFASGSARFETMIICPCSMGIVGRIASGISNDLMTRAADVMLKERRRLILVPRETPLSLIHLRNLTSITEAGGIICPAIPSFYSNPKTKEEIATTVIDRVLDLAKIESQSYRWGDMH